MMMSDLLSETYSAITINKARSALTILGIVIGVSSVIAMVAIGQGTQSSIESSIQSIGSNLIIVTPGAQRGVGSQISTGRGSAETLKISDAKAITDGVSGVQAVSAEIAKRYQITTKGKNTNTQVTGVTDVYAGVHNVEVEEGSFISNQNSSSSDKVAVIGPTTRDDLFGEGASAVGQIIKINKVQFKVIGVTKAKGGTGFNNPDDSIYIPLLTESKFLTGSDALTSVYVQAASSDGMTEIQQAITDLLLQKHKINDAASADFTVMNQADIVATASSVTGTLTLLLAAIAGISLVVGGIGIMNMMLTTVTERTREIGLRKAIGAKKGDISKQFLAESIMLTFLGGIIGVILGWLIAVGVSQVMGITTTVSWSSVILAFGVSAGIGIVFGYYPAKRAASLNPIEALRFE